MSVSNSRVRQLRGTTGDGALTSGGLPYFSGRTPVNGSPSALRSRNRSQAPKESLRRRQGRGIQGAAGGILLAGHKVIQEVADDTQGDGEEQATKEESPLLPAAQHGRLRLSTPQRCFYEFAHSICLVLVQRG